MEVLSPGGLYVLITWESCAICAKAPVEKNGNLLLKTGSSSALSESGAKSQKVIVQSCTTQ